MKLHEMIDCRHLINSEKQIIANEEIEELQKIISDRWDEIWDIVQKRQFRNMGSNS